MAVNDMLCEGWPRRDSISARRGFSSPPVACNRRKKKPVPAYELFLKYGGEGGIDSLRSPLLGPSLGLAPAGPA